MRQPEMGVACMIALHGGMRIPSGGLDHNHLDEMVPVGDCLRWGI